MKKNYAKYAAKDAASPPRMSSREGKLYQKIGRTGENETNALSWIRSWKQHKMGEYPPELLQSLKDFVRYQYDISELTKGLTYEPEVPTTKDCWTPTVTERAELATLLGDDKTWRERELFKDWFDNQSKLNAAIKDRNDTKKAQRDDIIKKGGASYKQVIGKLMGAVLADMSPESRQEVEQWTRDPNENIILVGSETREMIADNMDEAHEKGDWLFIFEAVQKTHLVKPMPKADTAIRARQLLYIENLKKIKHNSGSYERWIERFEDYRLICETAGCVIEDVDLRNYFMSALNPKIFADTIVEWKKTIGRPDFPDTYEELKNSIRIEYNEICADPERARVVAEVMFSGSNKGADKSEISLESREMKHEQKSTENSERKPEEKFDGVCWMCERKGHRMKDCWFYDEKLSKEENREKFLKGEAVKRVKPDAKASEKKKKKEKVNKCSEVLCACEPKLAEIPEREVQLKSTKLAVESCLVMGVKPNEVDFVYDSGTHHGVVSQRDQGILFEVVEDPVLLEGVGGHMTLSKEIGDSIFGKTRVLKNRTGSVLVSNYSTKDRFQVVNPDPDTFILRGWNHDKNKGKEYVFIRDEERYGDPLLHCTMPLKMAKSFAGIEKFYDPPRVPEDIGAETKDVVARVEIAHRKWNHASAQELMRVNGADSTATGVTDQEIAVWKQQHGDFCSGCLEGAMKEHSRTKSTKPLTAEKPGDIGAADLMFVEGRSEIKIPLYVHVDVATKTIIGVPMKSKTVESCLEAFKAVQHAHQIEGVPLKMLVFDRESAIMSLEPQIVEAGVKLVPKAAGQKVGLAEVNIRSIRVKARSTKAGVRERYGYLPANQFNVDLCMDSIGVLNRVPKEGTSVTPIEAFTGKKPDWIRDLRAEWGEPVIVKKPKGIASDLKVTGEWAIVVRRIMNGTGVLKVYLIQSKRYAYRLKFKRAKAPEWVLQALNSISVNQAIGFEESMDNPDGVSDMETMHVALRDSTELIDQFEEPEVVMNVEELSDDAVQEALDVINAAEAEGVGDAAFEPRVREESGDNQDRPMTRASVRDHDRLELERRAQLYGEWVASGRQEPEPEDVGKVVFDRKNRRTEAKVIQAQEVLRQAYLQRYGADVNQRVEDDRSQELNTEFSGILYQQALKSRPEAAEAALEKEVEKAEKKKIWHPVHKESLTEDQKKMILPMMKNYVEKFHPDSTFDKSKVRVLVRGDLQRAIGESEGPVCRFESILLILSIAAQLDLDIFKVDVSAAYMNTPMNDEVKHRWVHLDRDVVRILLKLNRAYYEEFVQEDGTMIVEMDKLMYGFREAAHFWNIELIKVFVAAGYTQCKKDKCVLVKRHEGKLSICGITVDDCLFAATRDDTWIQQQIKIIADAFEELTTERGDEIGIVGVQVKMDRDNKRVLLSQKKFADKVAEVFGVSKGAPNPALSDVMGDDTTSKLLEDQRDFMAKNSLLMFGATRTYPEIRPTVARLASKYNKASELDMQKARRVAEYVYGCRDDHVMILAPKSLQLVATSDASYAENVDGTSNDGGCVGLESDLCCWIAFVTGKQPVVAMSACEAELIAVNKVGTFVEWARQLMEELGFPQETVTIYQDSTCSIAMLKQGTGSFKRAKHIKVRFFWLKDLIDSGDIILKYCKSEELVADILTKPVTGSKFGYLLKKLIGWSRG